MGMLSKHRKPNQTKKENKNKTKQAWQSLNISLLTCNRSTVRNIKEIEIVTWQQLIQQPQ